MSYAMGDWAWDQECETSAQQFVLVCLASYASKEGDRAFPSVATICKRTRLDERTVRKALRDLVTTGLITKHERRPGNRWLSTEYRLNLAYTAPTKMQEPPEAPYPTNMGEPLSWEVPANMPPPSPINGGGVVANMGENPVTDLPTEKQDKIVVLRTTAPAEAAAASGDVRKQLFSEGKDIIRRTTGRLNGDAGGVIMRLLKAADQDCGIVLACLREAESQGVPADGVVGWVTNAVRTRCRDQRDPSKLSCAPQASYRLRQERDRLAAAERDRKEASA